MGNWGISENATEKELVDLMNSPSKTREGFTNWQATLIQYNLDNFFIQPKDTIEGTFDKKKSTSKLTLLPEFFTKKSKAFFPTS